MLQVAWGELMWCCHFLRTGSRYCLMQYISTAPQMGGVLPQHP